MANSGLASGCSFCPSSLEFLSSSSSQSEDANLPGHSFPNGVHMAQYLGCSLVCEEAVGEGCEVGMDYCSLTDLFTLEPGQMMYKVLHL